MLVKQKKNNMETEHVGNLFTKYIKRKKNSIRVIKYSFSIYFARLKQILQQNLSVPKQRSSCIKKKKLKKILVV